MFCFLLSSLDTAKYSKSVVTYMLFGRIEKTKKPRFERH